MVALKEEEFDTFLKQRLPNFSALLIHGDDEAVVSSLSAQAVARLTKVSVDSLLVENLDGSACKKSPGLFSDALNAMSLLGDKTLVMVEGVDDSSVAFLSALFEQRPGGNFVLLKAHALKRDSTLRVAFESGKFLASVAVFPDDERTAALRARNLLDANELIWGDGAEETFFALVGFERSIVLQEVGKLVLYCLALKEVTVNDVISVCGNLAEDSFDDVIDAVLGGDVVSVDASLGGVAGKEAKSILPLLATHLSRLAALSSAVAEGQTIDNALRSARPPVFFKRRSAIVNQLNRLSLPDLVKLQSAVQVLILKSRQLGDISDAATARALLSLARNLKSGAK